MRRGTSIARYVLLPDLLGPASRGIADAVGVLETVFGGLRRPQAGVRAMLDPRGPMGWLGAGMAVSGLGWTLWAAASVLAGRAAEAQNPPVPDLSGEPDQAGRKLLAFLSDLDIGNHSALSSMLLIYNGAMMILAGVLLVWWSAMGTVDTASKGRWGWTGKETLRIVAAFLLMVPLFGGLSGGQHLALSLARTGGDIAQLVWGEFSDDVLGEGRMVAPPPHQRPMRMMISGLLLVELCAATANNVAAAAGDEPYVVLREEEPQESNADRRRRFRHGKRTQSYDGQAGRMPKGMCGAVQQTGLDGGATAGGKMSEAHGAALKAVRPEVRRIAGELALWFAAPPGTQRKDDGLPDVEKMLVDAKLAETYLDAVGEAGSATRDEATKALQDALKQEAGNLPWTMAASLFMTITRHVGEYQFGTGNLPGVSGPSARLKELVPEAEKAVREVAEELAASDEYPAALGASADPAGGAGGVGGIGRGSFDWLDIEDIQFVDSGNPVLDLMSLGHSLVTKAMAAILLLGGLATGSNFLQSIPFIGGGLNAFGAAWEVMDSFVSTVLGLMMLAGLVLAYLVPALPFIRFLFGLLAWLAAVIAAVFAMPVWLAAHTVRGEGFVTPATRQGWLFLPGLVLRPVLMLFGLVTGYLLFVTLMDTFNDVFRSLVFDAGASDGIGVLGWLDHAGDLPDDRLRPDERLLQADRPSAVPPPWTGSAGGTAGDGETDRRRRRDSRGEFGRVWADARRPASAGAAGIRRLGGGDTGGPERRARLRQEGSGMKGIRDSIWGWRSGPGFRWMGGLVYWLWTETAGSGDTGLGPELGMTVAASLRGAVFHRT